MRDFKVSAVSVIVTLCVILLISFGLHLFSFEVVYDPKVITDWDAVSGVAAWAGIVVAVISVILSFVAIIVAIQVPQKIADRQNKIALFEKRYAVFNLYEKFLICYNLLQESDCIDDIRVTLQIFYPGKKFEDLSRDEMLSETIRIEYILHQMPLLFPDIPESATICIYVEMKKLFIAVFDKEAYRYARNCYITAMEEFIKNYGKMICDASKIPG